MDPRQERIGKNEALFREVNERISGLSEGSADFICECGNRDCSEALRLTLAEYEAVRADPTWFLVVPGHEAADVEAVVEQHGHYLVMRKHEGEPAELATDLDPRG